MATVAVLKAGRASPKIKFLLIVSLALALALIVILTWAKGHAHSHSMLIVGVGFPMEEVAKQSSLPVQFVRSSASSTYAEFHQNTPHVLSIVAGSTRLVVPDMQSVAMQAVDGKVSLIDDRPAIGSMTVDQALDWANKAIALVDASGWTRANDDFLWLYAGDVQTAYASLAQLREAFLDRRVAARLRRVRVATWCHGTDQLYLDIARTPYFNVPGLHMENDEVYHVTIGLSRAPLEHQLN